MPQDTEQPLSIETVNRQRWRIEWGEFRWGRRSFNTWLRSQGLQWWVDGECVCLKVKVGAEFKPLSFFDWSSPRLQALHELGLTEGARWLTGHLETEEAVMQGRAPYPPEKHWASELRLWIKLGRVHSCDDLLS